MTREQKTDILVNMLGDRLRSWCAQREWKFSAKRLVYEPFDDRDAACFTVAELLTIANLNAYIETLWTMSEDPHICDATHTIAYVNATAEVRIEALASVLGLWHTNLGS